MIALFVTLGILIVALIVLIFLYPKIRNKYMQKNYVKSFGKKIYQIAQEEDFYLINQIVLESNINKNICVNHLLFANKYIYVISDYYLEGELLAKENDNSWIFKPYNKKIPTKYIDNLLQMSDKLTKNLSEITGLGIDLFIPVVAINSNCTITEFSQTSNGHFLVHINHLKRLILTLEKRDVPPLDENQLYFAVRDLARLNLNYKRTRL